MLVLELFAGSRSIGKAFEEKGHTVYSIDYDQSLPNINEYMDLEELDIAFIEQEVGIPDVIWASPDCTTYSIAGISHHRRKNPETGNLDPISEYAIKCDRVNENVIKIMKYFNKVYGTKIFIENPRGGFRKMSFVQDLNRTTVTYCQYGDTRMKPTDIFSTDHIDGLFKPMCKNGMPCHVAAPRGSATGTQGIKGWLDRSKIPHELCQRIVEITEEVK